MFQIKKETFFTWKVSFFCEVISDFEIIMQFAP